MPSETPVADLLAATAAGDRVAFGRLAARYVDFVYAVALRRLGDRHAAEDVTQTVLITLGRKAARVRPHALAVWLHRTTLRSAANARRADRRRYARERRAARPEAAPPIVLPEPDPLLPLLDEAISGLNAADRRLIIERYLRGRSLGHVAAELGVSPAAARKRTERAVARLRRHFAGTDAAAVADGGLAATLAAAGPASAGAIPSPMLAANVVAAATPVAPGLFAAFGGVPLKAFAGLVVVAVLAGASLPPSTGAPVAAATSRPSTAPAAAVERTYDVDELIRVSDDARDYTPTTRPITSRANAMAAGDRLVDAVRTLSVELDQPDRVRLAGGRLTVRADPAGHAAVRQLIGDARAACLTQVVLTQQIVDLPLAAVTDAGLRRVLRTADLAPERFSAVLTDAEKQAFDKAITSLNATRIAMPRLTLFSGQRAYVFNETNGPDDGLVNGWRFDARATVTADHQSTAVAFTAKWKRNASDATPLDMERVCVLPAGRTVMFVDAADPASPGRRTVLLLDATPDRRR